MYIDLDIETLPGDLNSIESDMADVAETTELKCSLNKGKSLNLLVIHNLNTKR